MKSKKIKVLRPSKINKTRILTLRITEEEQKYLDELKKELNFDSMRDLIFYGNDVITQLKNWQKESYKFYILRKNEYDNLTEVEFDLLPKQQNKGGPL